MAQLAFPDGLPDEQTGELKNLTAQIHRIIVNFWENRYQINRFKGDLTQTILYNGIETMYTGYEHIVAELVTLVKNRGR
jgi:hypothetical protein